VPDSRRRHVGGPVRHVQLQEPAWVEAAREVRRPLQPGRVQAGPDRRARSQTRGQWLVSLYFSTIYSNNAYLLNRMWKVLMISNSTRGILIIDMPLVSWWCKKNQ
jgi:hypothetical protein